MGPGRASRRPTTRECGMVTAELAVTLPAVVLVLAIALFALSTAIDQLRCVDAAGAGARAAARGDPVSLVREQASRVAPRGSVITVASSGLTVSVSVRAPVGRLASLLPEPIHPGASATAAREDAAGP